MIQRDPSATQALLYVHPDAVPSGSAVGVGEGDSVVILFDTEPRDVYGQGTHYAYSPSYRTARACFVRTGPSHVAISGTVTVKDPGQGADVGVQYAGEVWVQASDPKAVASTVGDKPIEQAAASVNQVIAAAVGKAIQADLTAACASQAVAAVVGNPATLGEMAARLQPALQASGVGIGGVQLVNVGTIRLAMASGATTAQTPAAAATGGQFPIGDRVFAYWTDGNWYPAIIRGFKDGQYQVDWEGNPHVAWVPADHVRDDQ